MLIAGYGPVFPMKEFTAKLPAIVSISRGRGTAYSCRNKTVQS